MVTAYMCSDCYVQVSLMGCDILGWNKGKVSFRRPWLQIGFVKTIVEFSAAITLFGTNRCGLKNYRARHTLCL